jgi:hypothetical protein
MVWIQVVLQDLHVQVQLPMEMQCDNTNATYIATCVYTTAVAFGDQTANVSTKPLARASFDTCCNKLNMIDIYVPA